MPTLQFKGKNIIWSYHFSIPYHTLDEVQKLNFQGDKGDGNLIIEGDNLIALKAMLPQASLTLSPRRKRSFFIQSQSRLLNPAAAALRSRTLLRPRIFLSTNRGRE